MCAERDVPAQLALESGMACGFGACFGCVVPTRARLRAAVRRRPGARGRDARGRGVIDFCGIPLAHPVINGSGTFDAIAARRAFGDALLEALPVRRVRVEDRHARAAPGQPAAAAVGARRGHDQLDRPPQQGPARLPGRGPAPARRAAGSADRQRHGLHARGGRDARGRVRRARGGRRARAERVVPERRDRPARRRRAVGDGGASRRGAIADREAADREADARTAPRRRPSPPPRKPMAPTRCR